MRLEIELSDEVAALLKQWQLVTAGRPHKPLSLEQKATAAITEYMMQVDYEAKMADIAAADGQDELRALFNIPAPKPDVPF